MTTREKIGFGVVAGLAVLVCAASAWFFYLIHNPDRYIPRIIAYAQQKTGLKVHIRHIDVGLFPFTVNVYDVAIENPKPFPAGDFFKAPKIAAVVDVGMLFHRKVAFHSITLNKPTIIFISDPDGLWNFQNPATPKQAAQKRPRFSMGKIATLQVKDGRLLGSALIDPADTPGPVVFQMQNFSGTASQIHFDAFKSSGPPSPIAGLIHADAAIFGNVHLSNVRSDVRILPAKLIFKGFWAKTYRGQAKGDFTFDFADKKTRFDTVVAVTGVGPGYLLKEFIDGPEIIKGMMKANFHLYGEVEHTANPLAGIDGGGQFTIGKGEMPELNSNPSMVEAKRFRTAAAAGLPPSAFSSFAADMELGNRHIYSRRIQVDFYGVDASGAGDMNERNTALNYRGTVVVAKKQGFFTTVFARMFKGAHEKDGRLTFPVRLTGTWKNPQFAIVHGKLKSPTG